MFFSPLFLISGESRPPRRRVRSFCSSDPPEGASGKMSSSGSEITVTSPGKVILHGEHSVVYGKMAVAVSINLRTKVRIRPNAPYGRLILNLPDLGYQYSFKLDDLQALKEKNVGQTCCCDSEGKGSDSKLLDHDFLNLINDYVYLNYPHRVDDLGVIAFLYLFLNMVCCPWPSVEVTVTSEIPIGAGLGSSAAFSVAISGALYRMSTQTNFLETVNNNGKLAKCTSEGATAAAARNGTTAPPVSKKLKLECVNGHTMKTKSKVHADAASEKMEAFEKHEEEEICSWAYLAEKIILEGSPSGKDTLFLFVSRRTLSQFLNFKIHGVPELHKNSPIY